MNPADHRIMVAESDEAAAQVLVSYLRTCGYRVSTVKTPVKVLKRVLEDAPSLIVIDMMSPRRDGLKVCRDLNQNYAAQHIPVIMITAPVDDSDKIVALELGVDDFLTKPYNFHELNLRIERSLERATSRAESRIAEIPNNP